MIIFDEPYSNAFLYETVGAGYAQPYDRTVSPHSHPYLRGLLRRGFSKSLRSEALWHLLLFGPCCIAPIDNLDLRRLQDADLIREPAGVFSDTGHAEDSLRNQPELVRGLRQLLWQDLKGSKRQDVDKAIDFYVALRKSGNAKDFLLLSALLKDGNFDTYDAFVNSFVSDIMDLPFDDQHHEDRFKGAILETFSRSIVDFTRANLSQLDIYNRLHLRSVHWLHLLGISNQLNAPIKTNINPGWAN